MKKLMWFLIGFAIPLFLVLPYARALECLDIITIAEAKATADLVPLERLEYAPVSTSLNAANAANSAFQATLVYPQRVVSAVIIYFTDTTSAGYIYVKYTNTLSVEPSYRRIFPFSTGLVYTTDICTPDTDGDGIADEFDLYPDDPTSYTYGIISTIEDSSGNVVEITVKTDRGDIFTFGERPADMTGYQDMIYLYPTMLDGATLSDNDFFVTGEGTATNTDPSDYYQGILDQDTDIGTGSGFETTIVTATGTETDNEALQGILSNTAATTTNISRLGDYLDSINNTLGDISTLSSIDTQSTGASGGATAEEIATGLEVPQADIDSGLTTAGDTTDEYDAAVTAITGDIALTDADIPVEQQEKGDLETTFYGLINNNPISSIISGTSVTLTSPVSYITWAYGSESIKLDISGFETELGLFGDLLLSLVTLGGFFMIIRG